MEDFFSLIRILMYLLVCLISCTYVATKDDSDLRWYMGANVILSLSLAIMNIIARVHPGDDLGLRDTVLTPALVIWALVTVYISFKRDRR